MTNLAKSNCLAGILSLILFCTLAVQLRGANVTLTGADLYTNPNAVLHSTITSLSGTSLVFGPIDVSANQFEKLVSLPLSSLGQWEDADGTQVTVSLNLTRLSCAPVFGDSCGPEDHDTPIALGNGMHIVGAEVGDESNGSVYLEEFTDMGTYGGRITHDLLQQNTGFPDIGETYDVEVGFTLNASSTLVNTSLLSGSASGIGGALGRPAVLDFLLMRDNGQGEQYQLNSLTVISDSLRVIPEPASASLLPLGLLSLFAVTHRRFHWGQRGAELLSRRDC